MNDLQIPRQLLHSAARLADRLAVTGVQIVFAESCTSGWCAALLSQIPGISQYLCGSAVTYRNNTKEEWLDASAELLNDPAIGPVSEQIARQMCLGVLGHTPEADLAISVTGHLGPNAPEDQDGLIYIGVVRRDAISTPTVNSFRLKSAPTYGGTLRAERQFEAVEHVYELAIEHCHTAQ